MRILHIGLATKFTEGMTYQDNLLTEQNIKDGHEVIYIGDCYCYINGKLEKVLPEDRLLDNGMRLVRVPFKKVINDYFSEKVRAVKNLNKLIIEVDPDIILFHGCQGPELITVSKYKSNNPNVKVYWDCHEDYGNSATNILSKYLLHKVFYRYTVQKSISNVDAIFTVFHEGFKFLNEMYKIPTNMIELLPLGGILYPNQNLCEWRSTIRMELGLKEDDLLFIHTGKMDRGKKTYSLIQAFNNLNIQKARLILIGSIDANVLKEVSPILQESSNVEYLGWKSGSDLIKYLAAADLYIQPGTQSATLLNAICAGCAVAVKPTTNMLNLLGDTAFYIDNEDELKSLIESISSNPILLEKKRKKSKHLAETVLDYKVIASKLYK